MELPYDLLHTIYHLLYMCMDNFNIIAYDKRTITISNHLWMTLQKYCYIFFKKLRSQIIYKWLFLVEVRISLHLSSTFGGLNHTLTIFSKSQLSNIQLWDIWIDFSYVAKILKNIIAPISKIFKKKNSAILKDLAHYFLKSQSNVIRYWNNISLDFSYVARIFETITTPTSKTSKNILFKKDPTRNIFWRVNLQKYRCVNVTFKNNFFSKRPNMQYVFEESKQLT